MREILFRGKRVDNGKWVEGYLSFVYIDVPEKARIYSPTKVRGFDVTTETLGQYTGLKDKNGVRIFEGDICWFYGGDHYDGDWEASAVVPITDMTNLNQLHYLHNAEHIEVIGNIHDNPEMVKGDA